ncbi:hypothetical protein ACS78Q_04880 [Yersinia enterocolitica]|uniref:hypothetical protein n=1 Tax=Yersinia enterocolitica TaxID=630 RepID=UPI002AC43B3D|nr:hypothetical protein [Yersinia enterocolitica]HEN3351262.1 hypothetical protein [Yersinia enterocolitica]
MNEKPILFNAEMVNAILSGRKTQTRRIMKVQPSEHFHPQTIHGAMDFTAHWYTPGVIDKDGYLQPARKDVFGVADEDEGYTFPLGAVGDQLWVRETFQGPLFDYEQMESYLEDSAKFESPEYCVYRADGNTAPEFVDADDNLHCKWRPSIHMPRWASRINLLITGVRVERLNTISTGDARAEGYPAEREATGGSLDAWLWFRELWDGIYPDNTFEVNPWVWVINFERMEAK